MRLNDQYGNIREAYRRSAACAMMGRGWPYSLPCCVPGASVGWGVDAQSLTGAQRLYERTGMHIAARFASYEKELRAGKDLVEPW